MIDGQKQREALTAAERALTLLEKGRVEDARAAAVRAAQLDQVGAFSSLPAAIAAAGAEVESPGRIPAAVWDAVAEAVGPGPLAARVEQLRS